MAYRSGTYVAFHAKGTSDPTASDMKYFQLMKAWKELAGVEFSFVDSHDKVASVRDSSKRDTLRRSLVTRLTNSKNFVLITSLDTKRDTDWVPFEIEYAIDRCALPIIVTYVDYTNTPITSPSSRANYWPTALATRINNKTAHAIHIPFNAKPLGTAVSQFDPSNYPQGNGLGWYSREAYSSWGMS